MACPSNHQVEINQEKEHEIVRKKILNSKMLAEFQMSKTHEELVDFVLQINTSILGQANKPRDEALQQCSPSIKRIFELLKKIEKLVDDTPPLQTKSRYGNHAFQQLFDKLNEQAGALLQTVLSEAQYEPHRSEIAVYLVNSIGDRQRIDYGSGHELNFVCFLFCLYKVQFLQNSDFEMIFFLVFRKYLQLMRKIQTTYLLEPAGSQGVWGLDDYHFLPFLWGSAQLVGHKYLRPRSINTREILDNFAKDYVYLACILFIHEIKTGSFFETSPLLFDISGVKTWDKVNEGMVKMFKAEVLGKLPVMKHFFFGTFLPYETHLDPTDCQEDAHSHVPNASPLVSTISTSNAPPEGTKVVPPPSSQAKYRVNSCCVQTVPSIIAASSGDTLVKKRKGDEF